MEQTLNLPGPTQANPLSRIHEASAKFQRYKILLRRRWWFLLLTASIGVCVQALRITGRPQEFRSLAKLVAGGQMVFNDSVTWREQQADFYGTIIETVESAEMKRRALERVRALNPDLKDSDVEIRVAQTKGSAIFNILATGSEPKYTKIFLDALLDEFISFRQSIREQAQGKVLQQFLQEVVTKQKVMDDSLDKLTKFRAANNIITITNGNNAAAQFLNSLQAQRETQRTTLEELKLAIANVNAAMEARERMMNAGGSIPKGADGTQPSGIKPETSPGSYGMTMAEQDYLRTKSKITELKTKLDSLLVQFKQQHPMVQDVTEELAALKALLDSYAEQIQQEMHSQMGDIQRRVQVLDAQIAEKQAEALDLGAKIAEHEKLEKAAETAKMTYDKLFEKVEQLQSVFNSQADYVAIQERATAASENVEDWVMPIVVGLIAGVGAGIVVLLLFDRLDDRMNSFSEFQALFPAESVLGQVPEQRNRGDVALLRPNDDRHLYAEAFRNVRSSILFKNWQGKVPKTILITSAVPNEGKTTVTSNLAVTMALAGARVLLADCDLRRGGVSELFKLPSSPGLSEALRGKLHWRDAVQETSTRNLDLLARGDVFDQTSEMLLSKTAEEMLREMSEEYDYVIFDSAPVLVADDTASFAPKLDTVLFVVRMSSTMARLSGKALDLLYERQVNIGGVILNRSSSNLKEYTYYNYASYYYAPAKSPQQPSAAPATAKS
ncbi:MAG: polysaccharide biosynthesis tyrosine autokinase [Prosthecobacter sp.]|jgi:succinoglycan biosynthesis transport protein ExoP|uniref:polysaccharide biosynthesis tyrosine autokinase n=1 Tax=Prosthecobacter sp. TaxID=1965333 RepID=UPI0019FCAD41|nr:polysaccharide biosynthesis tyrosine autokinase [Prosthecobacter sp.]MBE2283039.1 polysaccharide biosynthesis tyrosine autokinase [Prosthecobacter sp.]